MRNAVILVILAILPGCLWMTPKSDAAGGVSGGTVVDEHGHRTGARLAATGGLAGLYVNVEADVRTIDIAERAADDRRGFTEAGMAMSLRASPLGILPTDHQLERWLDFGAEIGGAVGAVEWDSRYSEQHNGFVGGWLQVGTVKLGGNYLAIVGDVRQVSFAKTWRNETIVGVGLALMKRGVAGPIRD